VPAVIAELQKLDPAGSRSAKVLRETFDQLYDGQRTGRYCWKQLFKTEKTHCGTLVEINLQREFIFGDGSVLDYQIAGVEVDCKYSQRLNGWMIPPEAHGHVCLLVSAEDTASPTWNMGVVRITADRLNPGSNRDGKATLNEKGRNAIFWLFQNAPMPANVLLELDQRTVDRIFAKKSGRQCLNELFRSALGRIIGRAAVATVAQQDDYMKRIRANGGSRSTLKPEGIIILGQFGSHTAIARALGIPVPGPGDSVAVRVVPASESEPLTAKIGRSFWRVARSEDPKVPAPELPKTTLGRKRSLRRVPR
jgi:hypothetical protein